MNLFNELKISNKLCFDIGANVGNKTEVFLKQGAEVLCVEPQKECIDRLKQKYSNNPKVNICNSAVGESEGQETIFICESNTISTMSNDFMIETSKERFKNNVWSKKEIVNVTTLDKLIVEYGLPKYCKIDVEGYEVEVLKGLTKPIEYISIEFVPELSKKTLECIEIINNLGNYRFNYIDGESKEFMFDEWLDSEKIIKFLLSNNDYSISFGDLYSKLV